MEAIQPVNWEHDMVLYLIENYKANELLYRTDLPEYKDQNKRQKAIKDILCNILTKFPEIAYQGLTTDDVRKKIQSVRTQYIKEVRKIEKSIARGATGNSIFKSKWWCFDKLTFLTDQILLKVPKHFMKEETIPELISDPLSVETYTITPSERCRVCLMQSGCVLALEDQMLIEDNSMSLSKLLVMFTDVQIFPEDEKPQTICITCANEVKNMYKFKLTCERSDEILNNELLSLLAVDEMQLAYIQEMKNDGFVDEQKIDIIEEQNIPIIEEHNIPTIEEHNIPIIEEHNIPIVEELLPTVEVFLPTAEELLSTSEELLSTSEELLPTSEDLLPTAEELLPTAEELLPTAEELIPTANELLSTAEELLPTEALHLPTVEELDIPTIEHIYIKEEPQEMPNGIIEKVEIVHEYKMQNEKKIDQPKRKLIIDGEKLSDTEWKCTMCNKIFNKLINLQRHLRRGHKHMQKVIKCSYCDFVAETYSKLAKHKYHEHDDKKTLKCNICGKKFFKKVNLRLHMVVHTGEKRHSCEYCGRAFSLHCNLKTHLRLHTGEKPYLCLTCGKTFAQSSSLHVHQIGHSDTKEQVCSICGKHFKRKGTLRIHMKIHLEQSQKEHKCTLCGVILMAQGSLRRHMMTHTGLCKFECKECGKKFNRNSNLRVHMMIHTGETPFVCQICGKGFIQAHGLRNHSVTHDAEKKRVKFI